MTGLGDLNSIALNTKELRISRFGRVSTELSLMKDDRLARLIAVGKFLASGIGGSSLAIEVEGAPVFVKKVPLTDLEQQNKNILSTANLFKLPISMLYGIGTVGTTGFSAWRGLCTHLVTTGWVITGECLHFPMLYHWRILPEPTPPNLPQEHRDIAFATKYWNDSVAFGRRLEAGNNCSASLVLFQEYLPHTLRPWLENRLSKGPKYAEESLSMIERDLYDITGFLKNHGFAHMDAHFSNFLTDGHLLYLTDFDLALSQRFELSERELAFLDEHRDYDRYYALTCLANRVACILFGSENANQILQEFAKGQVQNHGLPDGVADLLARYANGTLIMKDFIWKFESESRTTPFPRNDLEAAFG